MVDCVIVGAGVVGASLALALGQTQRQVILLEKNPSRVAPMDDFQMRTIALSYASVRIYSALGVWEHLQKRAIPMKQVLVNVQGRTGACRLNARDEGLDALGFVVSAQELENVLYAQCAQLPNVTFHREATIASKKQDPQGWDITIQSQTQSWDCRAQLLIAADGVASQLRQEQGIACQHKEYGHTSILTNVRRRSLELDTALERFLPFGAIALIPWQEDIATFIWTTNAREAARLQAMDDHTFLHACQDACGPEVGEFYQVGKRIALELTMHNATQQTGARFLLMGNAAHSLHPIAAQGLNLSLRDIWQLRSQILRGPGIDMGSTVFLNSYLLARKPDQSRVVLATDAIASYMLGPHLSTRIRALGISLFDNLMPVKKMFTRYSMGIL